MWMFLSLTFLTRTALADYSQDMAYYSMYYAAAAYCDVANIKTWSCGDPCERNIEFVLTDVFTVKVLGADTSAFVGLDKSTGYAVVSFEGTHDPEELLDELTHFK
jgi:hypothetical protein